ncbi:MAG: glycosyltransferase [Gemmataceae bacterium]|nr:glycosyltransferase [Gemmataceae bacterium]
MRVVQLMASPFFGGPERQVLGLATRLPKDYRTTFLTFAERGRCHALLEQVQRHRLEGKALEHNFPNVPRAAREVARELRRLRADVVCCSGYKPDLIGWLAGRQAGVPVVSISHGWTAATLKVRFYEALDRLVLRWLDAVVCVSEGQAVKVRQTGVPPERAVVIRNAIDPDAFAHPDPAARKELDALFGRPPHRIVGAAGRLSPEKGFDQLIDAVALVTRTAPDVGFVLFGDGPLREALARRIVESGLAGRFVLAGFRADVGRFLPHLDVGVLSSFTEGLPVILLETMAAGVPVVSTAVGGTPEVIEDGVSGYLVPPGSPEALAQRILDMLADEAMRLEMGQRGQQRVRAEFTFAAQSVQYQRLFERLVAEGRTPSPPTPLPPGERGDCLAPLSPGGRGVGGEGAG